MISFPLATSEDGEVTYPNGHRAIAFSRQWIVSDGRGEQWIIMFPSFGEAFQ